MGWITPLGHDLDTVWGRMMKAESGMAPITRFDAKTFPTSFAAEVRDFDVKKFVKMIDSTSLNGVTIGGKSHYKVKWEMKDTDGNIQTFTYTLARSPSDNNWAKVAKGRVNRMIRQKNVNVKY